jgi:phage pi2 protein 07
MGRKELAHVPSTEEMLTRDDYHGLRKRSRSWWVMTECRDTLHTHVIAELGATTTFQLLENTAE